MHDNELRQLLHRGIDLRAQHLQNDPYLAARVLAHHERKDAPRMKKLSTGIIIAIVLMLLSFTALAVALSVEQMWQQSFDKMNTTGWIRNLSDESMAEISMDEAIAIARQAIKDKYATPDEELDAMGVYPTYAARGWDGKTDDYPSRWDIYFSSRTDVDIDLATEEYGPTGEYLVYINAETREVTYCNWYTNHFWDYAQRLWDAGLYDEVNNRTGSNDFYTQPQEQQAYWRKLLTEKGYEVLPEDQVLFKLLRGSLLDLEFCELDCIADNSDPQVAAAWQAVEAQYGYDAELLQKYAYVATIPAWQTGTDNVCIHYSYELQWRWLEEGLIEDYCNHIFSDADKCGLFMASFAPGTTEVKALTHVTASDVERKEPVTDTALLARTDWTGDDLREFDAAYIELEKALERMRSAGLYLIDVGLVAKDYIGQLGRRETDPDYYAPAPADVNAEAWFSDATAPTPLPPPSITREEAREKYGDSPLDWPLEVQYELGRDTSRLVSLPREGEMTQVEATELALNAIRDAHGQEALDKLGDYTIKCTFERYTGDYGKEITFWRFYIVDSPEWTMGWSVSFIGENYEDYGSRCLKVIDILEDGVG